MGSGMSGRFSGFERFGLGCAVFGLSWFAVVAWFEFWVCWWSCDGGIQLQGVLVSSLTP